ncbi:DNA internalization-related competence protein ComEC/Rec2 [bacterium endosymbiont of Escarpia laminata]|nr:MAG: DNA internalization-related competence protein ComEC/Rec2 [bacterium endosymbiont of Escarpia laminata]
MTFILLAFVTGTALFQLLPVLPEPAWFAAAAAIPLFWVSRLTKLLSALLAGGLWAFLFAWLQLSQAMPFSLEGETLIVTGTVASLPKQTSTINRFEFELETVQSRRGDESLQGRVRLNWYRFDGVLLPGQRWQLQVRLKRPRGLQNPAGFDYEKWLYSRRIRATGYVQHSTDNQLIGDADFSYMIDRVRHRIGSEIEQLVESQKSSGLIRALAIGDRGGISNSDWEAFTRTGTNHLIAISGLHIGIVAGLMFFLGQWLWRQWPNWMLWLPAPKAGAISGLLGGTIYAMLAGFSLPTQRALIMLYLVLGATLFGRTPVISRSFSMALFLVILLDPAATLSAGFWLSFGAVGVILLSVTGRIGRPTGWHQWGRVQWVVALGLAPLLFIQFGRASLVAPLVNLLLVPWFTLVLVPLILFGLPLLSFPAAADLWAKLTELCVIYTLVTIEWAANISFAALFLPDQPLWIWAGAMGGIVLFLLPGGLPVRGVGMLLLLPLIFSSPQRPPPGGFRLTLLDVGQGLSVVVETARHQLVYDTGPAFPSGFNTAEAALLPYLHSRGIEQIDRLVVSNGDQDHAGGVAPLLKGIKVVDLIGGESMAVPNFRYCRSGMSWQWDGVSFEILHPDGSEKFHTGNNASCVLRVVGSGGSLLIPGDVEQQAEEWLVERYGRDLKSDVLIAPHHGSATSSTLPFVDRVRPEYVLFPTGYRNRFGFPKADVQQRWRDIGSKLLNSAEEGAIQIDFHPESGLGRPYRLRRERRHYWSTSWNE